MARKRVHEIAKEQGLTSKELIAKLQAAGIEVKAAASSVEETEALKALDGNGAAPEAQAPAEPAAAASPGDGQPSTPDAPPADPPEGGAQAPKQRPTRDSLAGERAPGSGGG